MGGRTAKTVALVVTLVVAAFARDASACSCACSDESFELEIADVTIDGAVQADRTAYAKARVSVGRMPDGRVYFVATEWPWEGGSSEITLSAR